MRNYIVLFMIAMLAFGCIGQTPPQNSGVTSSIQTNTQTPPPSPSESPIVTQPQGTEVSVQEVNFNSDGWTIYGSMYPARNSNPTTTIVLAHMYSHDRTDYPQTVIAKLRDQIPNAVIIAIDLRGHGRSTNRGRESDLSKEDIAGMKDDVIAAKNFVKSRYSTVNSAYVVGASIGSTAAILAAAQDREFGKAALLSPALNYRDVSTRSSLESFTGKLLIVSSNDDDPDSRNSVDEMHRISRSSNKQIKIYSQGHGSDIFGIEVSQPPTLEDLVVEFLRN